MRIGRLKKRADFLRLRRAKLRTAAKGLVLQAAPIPQMSGTKPSGSSEDMRVGFTATKRIGNAVVRNRAKRRLRVLAQTILAQRGTPGYDYVLIARDGTGVRDFAALQDDLHYSLKRVGLLREAAGQ